MEKAYITYGTYDFLEKIKLKFKNEKMILIYNNDHALLFHETNGRTKFQMPRRFEIIESLNDIPKKCFIVINHVPIPEEAKPVFEYELKMRKTIEHTQGFRAIRILRPIKSDTYFIMTFWENEALFEKMKSDLSFFAKNHVLPIEISNSIHAQEPSYIRTYYLNENNHDN